MAILEMIPVLITKWKQSIIQILASLSGCTILISFGLMLGWPSPTYPHLLKPNATIPIRIDQTATIATALNIGVVLGTPLSSKRQLESKNALILSISLILCGWTILWQLKSLWGVIFSRIIIGVGSGFGIGQLKIYFREICSLKLGRIFQKYCIAFVNIGVILAYGVGGLWHYDYIALVGMTGSAVFLIVIIHVPHSPMHLLMRKRREKALRALNILRRYSDAEKINNLEVEAAHNSLEKHMSLWEILQCEETRRKYLILIVLLLIQQCSGITPRIVFSQLIFRTLNLPYPEYCALSFSITYLIFTVFGLKLSDNKYKKFFLVFSALLTSATISAQIATIVYDFNSVYWQYLSLLIINLYVTVYAFGLGCIPSFYVNEFPLEAKDVAGKTFFICTFVFGFVATKSFQVLFAAYGLYIPYCMFLGATTVGSVVIMFLPLFDCDKKNCAFDDDTYDTYL